ncbi:MAG: hypothetical protein H7141_00595 [Burkholderiales bacterium]|nr:hypothetical protein [Bacteroidia bacterium]
MKNNISKIFISIVAIIYVLSTIGVSVFSHYCGGELEKVTLFSKTKSCCGNEEETDIEDGCCKNEIVHVAFQKDFTFYTLANNIKAPVSQLFIVVSSINNLLDPQSANTLFFNHKKVHPPDLVQQELVSCSVIRI